MLRHDIFVSKLTFDERSIALVSVIGLVLDAQDVTKLHAFPVEVRHVLRVVREVGRNLATVLDSDMAISVLLIHSLA